MKLLSMFSLLIGMFGASSALAAPQSIYHTRDGNIYFSNGAGSACSYASYNAYLYFIQRHPGFPESNIARLPRGIRYAGVCALANGEPPADGYPSPAPAPVPVNLPQGVYHTPDGYIYFSNGAGSVCSYASYNAYLYFIQRHAGFPDSNIAAIPPSVRYDGVCALANGEPPADGQ